METSGKGQASDAQDFFEQVIKPQFSNISAIRDTHYALMKYINLETAIFVLRLYGSDSKKRYENLRRGFLTEYPDGHKMLFCDNTFAMPFAALKLNGYSYTAKQLFNYMNNSSIQCGFGLTAKERELSSYNWRGSDFSVNLNNYGWYLAHIIPVGQN